MKCIELNCHRIGTGWRHGTVPRRYLLIGKRVLLISSRRDCGGVGEAVEVGIECGVVVVKGKGERKDGDVDVVSWCRPGCCR